METTFQIKNDKWPSYFKNTNHENVRQNTNFVFFFTGTDDNTALLSHCYFTGTVMRQTGKNIRMKNNLLSHVRQSNSQSQISTLKAVAHYMPSLRGRTLQTPPQIFTVITHTDWFDRASARFPSHAWTWKKYFDVIHDVQTNVSLLWNKNEGKTREKCVALLLPPALPAVDAHTHAHTHTLPGVPLRPHQCSSQSAALCSWLAAPLSVSGGSHNSCRMRALASSSSLQTRRP